MNHQSHEHHNGAPKVAVVIPCYKASSTVTNVIERIDNIVDRIYIVDDGCPERSGEVAKEIGGERLVVLQHKTNLGVGKATLTGMNAALSDGADIIVKCDADGQHPPELIRQLIAPIKQGLADYSKGNRFYSPKELKGTPKLRLIGNAALSFITKVSSGYWNIFDPTNGFVAIHSAALEQLQSDKIDGRYFFESDMLFRLYLIGGCVREIPMPAIYTGQISSLKPIREILPFFQRHIRNTFKRIVYSYFLRNFSLGSIFLVAGIITLAFSFLLAGWTWITFAGDPQGAPTGLVIFPAMLFITAIHFLISFLSIDVNAMPRHAVHSTLARISKDT